MKIFKGDRHVFYIKAEGAVVNDYELSKRDFDLIDVVFRVYFENGGRAPDRDRVFEMDARELFDRFRMAHSAKIIYE